MEALCRFSDIHGFSHNKKLPELAQSEHIAIPKMYYGVFIIVLDIPSRRREDNSRVSHRRGA
jgi:hypothetical protein